MSARGRKIGSAGLAVSTLIAALIAGLACTRSQTMPSYVVERRDFRHQVTAEGILEAKDVTALTVPAEVESAVRLAWLAPEGTRVEPGDVVARFDPTPMRDLLVEGQEDLRSAGFSAAKTRVESEGKVVELDKNLELAELELDMAKRFQKTDDFAFSRKEILESSIDEELAGERKIHAAEARTRQETLGRTELELLEIRQRQTQIKIDQAARGLKALEVRAPHAGILTLYRGWNGELLQVGREMWRGQQIGEIPDLDQMQAEVFVLEADAGGLEVGKPAEVIVEADPDTVYPARIARVDTVAKPRERGSPVQYFGVTLSFDQPVSGTRLKPGHRVRAMLLLDAVDEALVVPRQAVYEDGGSYRVFVRNGADFTPRTVSIGATSTGLLVVTDGLAEGEVIALQPPDSTAAGRSATPAVAGGPALAGGR